MQKESLEEALKQCINAIESSNIPIIDKVELLINIKHFLESEKYESNIKVLQLNDKRRFKYDN